jgi:hypothetical protein
MEVSVPAKIVPTAMYVQHRLQPSKKAPEPTGAFLVRLTIVLPFNVGALDNDGHAN